MAQHRRRHSGDVDASPPTSPTVSKCPRSGRPGMPYAAPMPYRSSRALDAVAALKHLPDRGFARAMARTAADWDFVASAPIPPVPAESLADARCDIRLSIGAGIFGETPLVDLLVLSLLVARSRPRVVFEFGTFTGLGTLHLALNAPGAVVHTLDLVGPERSSISGLDWETGIDQSSIGSIYKDDPEASARIRQHWGDSREFDTTPFRGTVEFVFIDAAHSYDFVKNDTQKAIEMAGSGATVVWHDYSRVCPDVQRVVAEQVPAYAPVTVAGTSLALMRIP
jgi:Methyltransferase domain